MTLEQAWRAALQQPELLRREIAAARDLLLRARRPPCQEQGDEQGAAMGSGLAAELALLAEGSAAEAEAGGEAAQRERERLQREQEAAEAAVLERLAAREVLDDPQEPAQQAPTRTPVKAPQASGGDVTPLRPRLPPHLAASPSKAGSPGRLLRLGPAKECPSPSSPHLTTSIKTDSRSRATVITLRPSSPAAALAAAGGSPARGSPLRGTLSSGDRCEGGAGPLKLVLQGTGAIAAGLAQQAAEQQQPQQQQQQQQPGSPFRGTQPVSGPCRRALLR
jgi:hypothetical protein